MNNFLFANRLGQTTLKPSYQAEVSGRPHHTRSHSAFTRDLASFAEEYRKLSIDCLKVLRVEMQLETLFHLQVGKCELSIIVEFA